MNPNTWMPTLCKTAASPPEGDDWALEGKYDGWRAIVARTEDAVRVFGGRNNHDYTGQVPHIAEALHEALPPDTILDGELIGSREGWGDVQSAMTRNDGRGAERLRYVVFDCLRVGGVDARRNTWEERRAVIEALPLDGETVRVSPVFPSTLENYERMLALGLEGSVYKRRSATYAGCRTDSWVKVKPQETTEAVVTGFQAGERGGQWDGKCGAFVVRLLDTGAETTAKCGTDARHLDATDHPERWLGCTVELKHHGWRPSGKVRHPQFLRRRDDRDEPSKAPPAAPAPAREVRSPVTADGWSRRNYAAMKPEKLERCVRELAERCGDAYDRVAAKNADPDADLRVAREALAAKQVPCA